MQKDGKPNNAVTSPDQNAPPLLSPDPALRYAAVQRFWHDVHRLINDNRSPEQTLNEVLKRTGLCLGADRAYTFAVTTDRKHTSCTCEWTGKPELALKHMLQNVDQRGLKGWLDRFKSSTNIIIEDVDNPPPDLKQPAAKFARDLIKSIYVFGFYDEGRLIGYLGVDYVTHTCTLDDFAKDILFQLASTLNLFILRHETLELWNRTVQALPSALFIKDVDDDLRYVYANPRYLAIFGEDVIGKDDYQIFGAEAGGAFRQQDFNCLANGEPFVSNGPQTDRSGKPSGFYALTKFPVRTQAGRHYIAGFITDISTEHDLRLKAQELVGKSKAAERAKSLFLASMSHEIRTPLNAIIGLVDELRHDDIAPETRSVYLESVSTASHSLLALINDVLDMSKLEAGQMPITPVETDVAALFDECEKVFGESCRSRGIAFARHLDPGMPALVLDTTRIRQILFNLVSNAVKFTREGGITLTGRFTPVSDEAGTFAFSVSDTGIGIAEKDRANIFGLFVQAESVRGTRVANAGTGIGLCLCKRLAQCMHGDIALESEPGRGSTFTVTLHKVPFMTAAAAAECAVRKTAATKRPLVVRGRVMIVDDLPLNLKVLGLVLKRAGIEPVEAHGGAEALELLARDRFGYVLTDLWMPGMNGEDLVRRIRENPGWNHLRVAAQTADVEASSNFDASLFDAVLSKPITAEKVLAFLQS